MMNLLMCRSFPILFLQVLLFVLFSHLPEGFPGGTVIKNLPTMHVMQETQRHRFNPWVRKMPWRSKWQPTPVFCPGKSCGQRSLAVYSPWGHKELDMTEWQSMHTCILPEVFLTCLFKIYNATSTSLSWA